MTRNATFGALVLALLTLTSGLAGVVAATPTNATPGDVSSAPFAQETTTTQENETVNATGSVTFDDQTSNGSAVEVAEANLSAGGFVVVFAQNGTVLGNTSYLEPGTHENLTVTLDTPIGGSQVLVATPHLDTNDNQTFEFNATRAAEVGAENATDRPYLQSTGLPVSAVAFVTVGNETTRRTTTAASRVAPDR